MTRPNKILSETMTYNLTIEKKDYEELRKFSTSESDKFNIKEDISDSEERWEDICYYMDQIKPMED